MKKGGVGRLVDEMKGNFSLQRGSECGESWRCDWWYIRGQSPTEMVG